MCCRLTAPMQRDADLPLKTGPSVMLGPVLCEGAGQFESTSHVRCGGARRVGELWRFSVYGSASATKLKLDSSIPVDVGGLQDRLQMSLLPPDIQRLEVLEE